MPANPGSRTLPPSLPARIPIPNAVFVFFKKLKYIQVVRSLDPLAKGTLEMRMPFFYYLLFVIAGEYDKNPALFFFGVLN